MTQTDDMQSPARDARPERSLHAYAAGMRRAAWRRLDSGAGPGGTPRLILTLGLICSLTMTVLPILMLDGIYLAAAMYTGSGGIPPWVEYVLNGVSYALALLLGLPLLSSVYRLAVRMTLPAGEASREPVTVRELFYAFSSWRAYGRCLRVGLDALFGLVILLLPVVGGVYLSGYLGAILLPGAPQGIQTLVRLLGAVVGLIPDTLLLLLLGWRAGYAYTVFAFPDESLAACGRRFRASGRLPAEATWLRLSYTGWFFLSLLCVCVPFLFHTIPGAMMASAAYGRRLFPQSPEDA